MEEDFNSIYIGENTLAAIEVAENAEKYKHTSINPTYTVHNKEVQELKSNLSENSPADIFELEKSGSNHSHGNLCGSIGKGNHIHSLDQGQSEEFGISIYSLCPEEEGHNDCKHDSMEENEVKCNLGDWGLPKGILKKYEEMGVKSMFQWQVECLSNQLVLSGKNLIYSAPTSAGKTLVAELLTIKTVIEQKKKAIIILPFVSVVVEKTSHFQLLVEGCGIRVEGFMGGHSPIGGFQRTDIAICTIEKANSLINRLMEDGGLGKLGIVVVDELHLLGDSHRGYLLELLLTKLQYMCARDNFTTQIIGMSATLPNLKLLANWLHAELYQTNFRPVPLKEYIKFDKNIYNRDLKLVSQVNLQLPIQGDNDDLALLCVETISEGFSVLIFCPTKSWCEKLAETVAKSFFFIGTSGSPSLKADETVQKFISHLTKSPVTEVLEKLRRSPVGLDPILARTVAFGVAFHHAGLTMDEREILEASFRSGSLRVLVATSTLSSGVNLPARRVIIRTPLFHGQLLDVLTYRQMIGRAGRMGVDTAGESILVCHEKERGMVERLLTSDLPPIQSCLGGSKVTGSLKRAIFEVIASGVASTPKDIESYASFTLLMAAMKEEMVHQLDLQDPLKACLKYLEENEFIRLIETEGEVKYTPTALGEACLAASLPPDQALSLFEELQRARRCFVLEDELHIIYQVTPFSVADQWGNNLDWLRMLNIWQLLSPSMQRVGELIGVEERFMVRAMRGSLNIKAPKQLEKIAIHRRFYTALALQELANETPLNDVAQKYGCSRGMLQNLQQSAATFAGMVTQFCQRLRWSGLELLASQFQDRLQFGIRRELCDLMRLPMMDGQCARALYDAGIETLAMLAVDTSPETIEDALRSYVPFHSEKNKVTDSKGIEKLSYMSGGIRYLLGKNAAQTLIEEARKLLQKDLGVAEMKWNKSSKDEKQSISLNDHGNQTQIYAQKNELMSNNVEGSTSIISKSKIENHMNLSSDIMANIDTGGSSDDRCIISKKASCEGNSLESDQNSSPVGLKHVTSSKEFETGSENAESNIHKNSFHDQGRDLIAISNGIVPDTPDTSDSPTITSHLSGRSSRRSIDIFSSPVGENPTNNSYRSPSLFGDSFTIDTQLGGLLDGSSGSDRINNLSHNSLKGQRQSLDKTLKHMDESKINADIFPNQSTPTIKSKPLSVVGRFKLEESLSYKSSPSSTPKCLPGKRESLDICPAVGPLTPGEWDLATVWNIEEDVCSNNSLVIQNDKELLKVDSSKRVDEDIPKDNSLLNRTNLTNNDGNNSSLLEKIFMASFEIDGDSMLKLNEDNKIDKEINLMNERVEEDSLSNFDDEEGWGGYMHNCSLEAVHHSIISPACNPKEVNIDVVMSSDEDDGMILSSQEHNTVNMLSHSKRSVVSKENFSRYSSKMETDSCWKKLSIIACKQSLQEKDAKVFNPSIEIDLRGGFRPSEKLTTCDMKKQLSEVLHLDVIDVCKDVSYFKKFCEELEEQKVFSFSVAASRFEKHKNKYLDMSEVGDGNTTFELSHQITPSKRKRDDSESEIDYAYNNEVFHLNSFIKVDGIAFACDRNKVYFMSLSSCEGSQLRPSHHDKIVFLKRLFESSKRKKKTCIAMDLKEHLKALIISCDIMPSWSCRFFDPKIGDWLLNPTAQEKNLSSMCMTYCPELWKVLEACNKSIASGKSHAADIESRVSPNHPSAVESLISLKCMHKLESILLERNLFDLFSETEMPTTLYLAQMEALGVGFSKSQGESMKSLLLSKMKELENKAYSLAGHIFRISSPIEVGKVLYLELRLPIQQHKNFSRTKRRRKWSTSKESLEKLTSVHLLPRVILEWRKISSILNKTVHPLLQCTLKDRIYGRHITHTSTGRISMHEPNLQNIPRNFEILSLNSVPIKSNPSIDSNSTKQKGTHVEDNKLSIRHCFLPAKGFVFLSADYSQLELRIMAYLSKDEKLCSILNKGADVFTMIASLWKNIDSTEVTPVLRQQTKKICYGILYGIGCKSLAQQLEVEEKEALNFMETFKNTFPGLNKFLITTVEKCKSIGYVETIGGRRRDLPAINSTNPTLRAQAERQAVNTLVQGSAADLVKVVMVRIMMKLKERFPPLGYQSPFHNAKAYRCSSPISKKFQQGYECNRGSPAGAVPVLHLHDELLFEVAENDIGTVADIVKSQMEAPWKIEIHLPVNVKVGRTWGTLGDY